MVLVITNTTTATSTLGVTVSDNWGLLRIVDDEPAAKVVGITSDGEAIRGDWFFLVVAGADSDALGVSGIVSAAVSSTGNIVTGNVNPIAMVDDIVRGMHGLNTVRSKAATHAWLYMVPTSTQLGTLGFDFTLTYGSGGPVNLTSTAGSSINLEVVGSRSNRNFFLSPGLNFTGLGLVPLNSSTATQLEQAVVSDVDTQFADAVAAANNEREVRLKDVVSTVFIFDCPDTDKPTCVVSNVSTASWSSYLTVDPLATGTAPFAGTLLLEPFHGMIVKARQTSGAGSQSVFATVTHGNLGTVEVPIKMNIKGPFIDVTTNVPLAPPEQKLRFGWNLVAPHTQEAAPFNIVFNDVVVPEVLASRAISFIREVTVGAGSSVVGTIVQQFAIATWQEIIRPEFAYWVRINPHPAGSVTPIIGPSGADGGSSK